MDVMQPLSGSNTKDDVRCAKEMLGVRVTTHILSHYKSSCMDQEAAGSIAFPRGKYPCLVACVPRSSWQSRSVCKCNSPPTFRRSCSASVLVCVRTVCTNRSTQPILSWMWTSANWDHDIASGLVSAKFPASQQKQVPEFQLQTYQWDPCSVLQQHSSFLWMSPATSIMRLLRESPSRPLSP